LLVAADWRWVFLVNVPIGLAALYVGWRRLPHVPGHPVPRPDALGAGLLSAGVAGLTLALVRGEDWGWGSTATLATLGIAVALLSVFVGHCLRARNPLVEPALFRAGGFAGSSIVMTLFSISFGAMLLSLVLWMQDVWGWSALATGLAIAPGPLMVPLFSFLVAGRLIARFGPAPVVTAGTAIFAAGLAWWAAAAQLEPDYAGSLLGGMLATGVGVGLTLPTLMATAAASLPPRAFATGSAVVNMLRQVGVALGVALLVALLGTPASSAAALTAFQTSWLVLAAIALAAAVVAAVLLRTRTEYPPAEVVPAVPIR
jgi:MFS family permease